MMGMMRFCKITEAQAESVLQILKDECGYCAYPYDGLGFIRSIMTEASDREHVCHEYRFMGAIGSGGKFRNNGNCDNTPYVDAYPENLTPARSAMIERANKRLKELFSTSPRDIP